MAAKHADGAHPYNVTSVHTAEARRILGADKLLCPEQKVLLETDPVTARGIGRGFLESYLRLPNYRNHFLRMGFTEQDMENGGSNRLIDGIIAWGDEDQIRARHSSALGCRRRSSVHSKRSERRAPLGQTR